MEVWQFRMLFAYAQNLTDRAAQIADAELYWEQHPRSTREVLREALTETIMFFETFELTKTRTRGSFFRTFTTSRQSTCCTNSVSVFKKYSVTRVPRKRPSLRTSVSVSSRCFEHPVPLGVTFVPFFDLSTFGCQTEQDQTG